MNVTESIVRPPAGAGRSQDIDDGRRSCRLLPPDSGGSELECGKTLRVLLIEDNDADAELVIELLQGACAPDRRVDVERSSTLSGGLDCITAATDVILLDLGLPDAEGALQPLHRALPAADGIPIVVLSGYGETGVVREAIRLGAADYVVKDLVPSGAQLLHSLQLAEARAVRDRGRELQRSAADSYAASVAHDLRGKLAVISGMSSLLTRSQSIQDRDLELVTRMHAAAVMLGDMVSGMLEHALAGDVEELVPVCLDDVVAWVRGLYDEEFDVLGADLHCPTLGWVEADEGALRTILANLIGNALKYRHPDRLPEITVTTTQRDGTVTMSVNDNGLGIPTTERDAVFEKGVRGRDHTADGLGLGLATVKRLVESINGTVWVDTPPGAVGTTVAVSMNAAEPGSDD